MHNSMLSYWMRGRGMLDRTHSLYVVTEIHLARQQNMTR